MSTAIGNLIESIGAALEATFAADGYTVIYGQPVADGTFQGVEKTIRVHWMQTQADPQGNQLAGLVSVRPRIAVQLYRPLEATHAGSTPLVTIQDLADLEADLRLCITQHALNVATGATSIALLGSLWINEIISTPSSVDLGDAHGYETMTLEITYRATRNYGGR